MSEYGNFDTNSWTPRFVSSNQAECLRILRSMNSVVADLVREKNYVDAVRGMKTITLGLIKMENENLGDFGEQIILLALLMASVTILGLLDADAPESRRREAALRYALDMANNPSHELSACFPLAEDIVRSYISDLKSGVPLERIKKKYNFPQDIFDSLASLDRDLSIVSPSSSSSSFPGWAVLLVVAVIGVLLFCTRPHARRSTSFDNTQQTETPAEETLILPETDQPSQDSGFIFSDSSTALIAQEEIDALSDSDLTYAINEIYARHGYIFRSDELRGYYEQFSWYTGEIPAGEFSVDCFNQIEQQNWNLLVKERDRRRASN